jgi:hypothetical protein
LGLAGAARGLAAAHDRRSNPPNRLIDSFTTGFNSVEDS